MDQIRILIIDDERNIRDILTMNLRNHGYELEVAEDGQTGLSKVQSFHPHLVVLDLGLPQLSGEFVLREIRKWTQVPVIVLTVIDDEATKVKLLDLGADDYLTKPFSMNELQARIRVCLRHLGQVEATPIFESGKLTVDLNLKMVKVNGSEIKLTKTEFEVLQRLVRDAGKVVPQAKLMKEVWGSLALEESHYLRIYIKQLRKKIEREPSRPVHILTEPGVGYRLV